MGLERIERRIFNVLSWRTWAILSTLLTKASIFGMAFATAFPSLFFIMDFPDETAWSSLDIPFLYFCDSDAISPSSSMSGRRLFMARLAFVFASENSSFRTRVRELDRLRWYRGSSASMSVWVLHSWPQLYGDAPSLPLNSAAKSDIAISLVPTAW